MKNSIAVDERNCVPTAVFSMTQTTRLYLYHIAYELAKDGDAFRKLLISGG